MCNSHATIAPHRSKITAPLTWGASLLHPRRMNLQSIKSAVLVFVGALAGCGAGATVVASYAAPAAGSWQCYDSGELPDLAEAATSWFAEDMTKGMNLAAP